MPKYRSSQSPSIQPWRKRRFKHAKFALMFSLIFHAVICFYIFSQIGVRQIAESLEDIIAVEWVPPPPVKLKIHTREIPKEVPEVAKARRKAPATLTTKLKRRAPEQIAEVTVDEPEIVRESVLIQRDVPISQILPVVTAAANFEAKAETRDTIASPVASPKVVAAPSSGIVTNRVRAASGGVVQDLSDGDAYGTNLRGTSGWGAVLGDAFADVGTTPPRVIAVDEATDAGRDMFGIGEYIEETRGDDTQEVVFVLDVSSSMSRGAKLRLMVQALKGALAMLYEGDSFNIVTFHSVARMYSKTMLPIRPGNIGKAHQFLDQLKPGSGTNLWEGLKNALALEASTVVLISDGDPSRGIDDPKRIIALAKESNKYQTRIATVALGHGHSDRGVRLLKRLADEHGGQLLLIDLR